MNQLYLYRVLENDEDGDPFDHGVIRAKDREELEELLMERLTQCVPDGRYEVRVYPLDDRSDSGCLGSNESFILKVCV